MEAIKIGMSALDVEWARIEIIAQNLANINSTRTSAGGAFKPLSLVSGPATDFRTLMSSASPGAILPQGVEVLGIEEQANGLRRVFEPDHPHADTDGFVSYPDIDRAAEMTMLIKSSRAYEANLTAISVAQQMYTKALEIGKSA